MMLENMIRKEVREMPPSGIRKYFDIVNEMEDVISLGVGEPDFVTPWNVREAGIYSLEQGDTHYSSNAGFIELREEIAKYLYRKFDLKYNPKDEILVTVGGSEGIDIALINLKAENDFKLTAQELEEAITEKTKVVIIPFPNNPTGAIMTREELAPLVEVLKDKDVIVISDEIYAELSYDKPHVSIASFPEIKDKTLVINGFSKSYAMTGWRLGYVCGHHILLDAMKKIHQYAIMCSPTTAQFAAIEALKNGDESVSKMVKEYNRRRRVLVDGFRKLGLDCFEPLGAFYVFPCIKSTGMTSDEFCEKLLLQEKVLAVPGNAFGECGEGFIRACYASSMENIMEALKRIEKFLNEVR